MEAGCAPLPFSGKDKGAPALPNFPVSTDTMLGSCLVSERSQCGEQLWGRGSRPGCYVDRVQASQAPAHQEAAMSAFQPERAKCPCEPCT